MPISMWCGAICRIDKENRCLVPRYESSHQKRRNTGGMQCNFSSRKKKMKFVESVYLTDVSDVDINSPVHIG